MRIKKRGVKPHFTIEMDLFFFRMHEYLTWGDFADAFKTRFARFANNQVVSELTRERLINKLRARDQLLKKMKKDSK